MLLDWDDADEYKKIELAAILETVDVYEPSIKLFNGLYKKHPADRGLFEHLIELYSKSNQLQKALDLINEWETINLPDDTLKTKKKLIEKQLNNISESGP